MIYILPIEKLKERFSFWWDSYIPNQFTKRGIKHEIITGESLSDTIKTGTFLDAGSTNYFKSVQLQKISKMFYENKIEPYSSFFVNDIWFPGIEMIRYMSHAYNAPVRIWGVWHAGSSTFGDFIEPMHHWAKHFEIGFLNICDGIFVGSEYSKEAIIERLLYTLPQQEIESISNRIYTFGMPIDYNSLQKYSTREKENTIIFPHRPDEEKNPNIFIDIINSLSTYWDDFNEFKFIFCTSKKEYKSQSKWINALLASVKIKHKNVEVWENLSKEDYYKLIGTAKLVVSTTMEENFGYCVVEPLAMGTNVLVPNAFSHPEILENNHDLMYDSYDEMLDKIINLCKNQYAYSEIKEYVKPYDIVVEKWIETIK